MAGPDEDQPSRPLRRDAERNRQRILAAATEVFSSRGLRATLDDVAHQAEYAGAVRPEIWRRYLALIIDGLRPARDGVSALPADALTAEEMVTSMRAIRLHRQ